MKCRLLFALLVLIAVYACGQSVKPYEHQQTQEKEIVSYSMPTHAPAPYIAKAITSRFLELIRHIDSLGYVFDTVRYTPYNTYTLIREDGYLLFEIQKENTILFYDKQTGGEHPFHCEIEEFNVQPFEKALKVVSYYFKQKVPDSNDGKRWYADGHIEEWTFDTEHDAQAAMAELIKIYLPALYANTGACVCVTGSQLYIFYSRASMFMAIQKKFFEWFMQQNEVELYKNQTY